MWAPPQRSSTGDGAVSLATMFGEVRTPEQEKAWSFSHMAHHRLLAEAVYDLTGVQPPLYTLDPWDPDMVDLHQQMHNSVDAVYGVSGLDLSDVDWQNADQRKRWLWLNATLHQQEQVASGVNG